MLIMIGASASGKTEIAKILISNYNFHKMVTYTTRDMRPNEVNHIDYHFITRKEFLLKQSNSYFIETSNYSGNLYGTAFKDAEVNRVLIVEPEGANNIYSKNLPCTAFFYLEVPNDIRKARMISRGDNIKDVERRIMMDETRFIPTNLSHIDYTIDTSSLSLEELAKMIFNNYNSFLKNNNC